MLVQVKVCVDDVKKVCKDVVDTRCREGQTIECRDEIKEVNQRFYLPAHLGPLQVPGEVRGVATPALLCHKDTAKG